MTKSKKTGVNLPHVATRAHGATLTVTLETSEYGCPQPTARLALPRIAHYRLCRAALHRLAAEIELATPSVEGWIVQVSHDGDVTGRVYLELLNGDEAEAARGMAVLEAVTKTING